MGKNVLLRTKQCRVCNLPFSTTSNIAVVHPECRGAYYRKIARESYHRKPHNVDRRGFSECFTDRHCEVCGYDELTREYAMFDKEGNKQEHTLCFNCRMKVKFGLMEAITWAKLEAKPLNTSEA